ncbi:type II toxin-antitoxin system RelE/ParE family toxin [Elusimicrobiota bacterium]
MGAVKIVFYKDEKGCPALEWLDSLPPKAFIKGTARANRLGELEHDLRRPEADYLRDRIYELRWKLGSVNYRLLYFFHGQEAVVLAHGLAKEKKMPDKDIDLAVERRRLFLAAPQKHSHMEELK